MHILFRGGVLMAAMTFAAPLSGLAQAVTTFDGTYVGVSGNLSGSTHCVPAETPAPLTISQGNAATSSGFFTGTVDATGHVVLHTKQSTRFDGQIDGSGTLKAEGTMGQCSYTMVWKKK
jgi:hypothetical protein